MTTGKSIALTRQTFVGKGKSRDITLAYYIQIKFISFYSVNKHEFCYLFEEEKLLRRLNPMTEFHKNMKSQFNTFCSLFLLYITIINFLPLNVDFNISCVS